MVEAKWEHELLRFKTTYKNSDAIDEKTEYLIAPARRPLHIFVGAFFLVLTQPTDINHIPFCLSTFHFSLLYVFTIIFCTFCFQSQHTTVLCAVWNVRWNPDCNGASVYALSSYRSVSFQYYFYFFIYTMPLSFVNILLNENPSSAQKMFQI